MIAEDDWSITDLTDMKHQDFPHEVKIAREMLEVMKDLENSDVNVRIPRAATEFIENTLSEWFEIIADIEKRKGNLPYLIDRDLYLAGRDSGIVSWNQGLTLEDVGKWLGDWGGSQMSDYTFMPPNEITKSEEPLSGYYNRLFPVKFVMRIMVILILNSESYDKEDGWDITKEGDDPVTLTQLREVSSKTASYARNWLKDIDNKSGSERGSEFSTGFPEDDKSKERFVAQFVGSKRKNKLSGSIFEMGFANIPSFMGFMNADDLHLTPQGWEFATLENPLLDDLSLESWKKGNKFSEKEVIFLLNHFKDSVPGEWSFIQDVLKLIDTGINSPKTLEISLINTRNWEKAHASIMKNGVLSRMHEMELIERNKEGRNVTYSLTTRGKNIIVDE